MKIYKITKKLTIFLVFSFASFPSIGASSCSSSAADEIKVNYVIDGDTFKDVGNQSYRINGIDAPETHIKNSGLIETTGWQHYYGIEAKSLMEKMLKSLTCYIEFVTTDQYQRKVVKAFSDNKDLGYEMVANGLSIVAYISLEPKNIYYTNDSYYFKKLVDAQHDAQIAKRGFWNTHNADTIKEIYPN